jgi:hypothetical protein
LKSVVIILAILFSSFSKTSSPAIESVCGVWKGYFGTENEINEITIKIDQQNQAEIFCNYSDACITTKGTYKLLGDSSIIISCLLTQTKSSEVILYGNLNRSSSFIDGQWDGTGKERGCFYLQKQIQRTNL